MSDFQPSIIDSLDQNPESFVILDETENFLNKVDSIEDVYIELEHQFDIEPELGTNRIDLLKIFCVRVLGIDFKEFTLDRALRAITNETEHEFYKFINRLKYMMYEYFGITFGEDVINEVELLYLLYSTFVLYPENFLLSFALYNQFYLDGFTFVDFSKEIEITDILKELGDSTEVTHDSEKYIALLDKLNTEYSRHVDDPNNTEYTKRNKYFVQYLGYILDNLEGEGTEDLFLHLNQANHAANWEVLQEAKDALYAFRIEEDVLVNKIKEWYINVETQEAMITKIAEIFFNRIKELAIAEFGAIKQSVEDDWISRSIEDYGVHKLNYRVSAKEEEYYQVNDENIYLMLWEPNKEDLFSRSISNFTKSRHSHASFALRKDIDTFFEMSESVHEYKSVELKLNYMERVNRNIDIFQLDSTSEAKKEIIRLMKHFKFKVDKNNFNYSYKSILKIFFGLNKKSKNDIDLYDITDRDEFICSSFVILCLAHVDERIRLMIQSKNITADQYTPKMLYEIPFIKYMNTYDLKNRKFLVNQNLKMLNKYRYK